MKHVFLFFAAFFLFFTCNAQTGEAFTLSNENYMLETQKTDDQGLPKPTQTLIKENNRYQSSSAKQNPFVFSVSETLIDFGTLSPTDPVTRTNRLAISTTANGYSVIAFSDHPLASSDGAVIPDTTCDNGSCSQIVASMWETVLAYGFGYRCDGLLGGQCHTGFIDKTYYKHFANARNESPVVVVRNKQQKEEAFQITYKVNISATQPRGRYTNTITYIAAPDF